MQLPRTSFQHSPKDNIMARCFWHLTPVEHAAALFFYEPKSEAAQMVLKLKYGDQPEIGTDLGRMMAEEMMLDDFFHDIDCIVPVPLTRRRQWQRGYNQSKMLAEGIAEVTRLPIAARALQRRQFRKSQTKMTKWDRRTNVTDAFVLRRTDDIMGKHVLIVDDVCTTGATMLACADAMKGVARSVSFLSLAFTKR